MSGAWLLALATVGVLGPPAGASLTAASILRRTSPGEQGPASAPGGLGPLRVSKRYDLDLQTCVDNFDVQRDQIIRTQDSKRMGAVNLAVKDVLTRDECLRLCCETDKCDVFVFEEKQSPGTCYMFHCGPPGDSRCKFTRHESYTTGILDMTRRILDQHEQDLNSLRILLEPTPSPLAGVRLLSSKTGPVMTAPGMASSASSSAAAAGVQTQGCSMYQFRCRHTASVECIAVYNQCDGIPQCSDRSDELGCPSEQGTTVVAPPAGDAAAFSRGVGLAQGQKLSEDLAGDSHVHAQELLDLREQQYQLQREKQQQLFQAQQPGQSLPDTKPQQPPPPPPPEQPMNPYTYRNWQQQQPVHSVQPQQQQKQQQQIQQQQQQIQQSQESKAQQLSLSDQLGQLQLQPGSGVLRAVLPASHQTDGAGSLAVGSKASMQGPRAPSQPEQESQLPVQQRPQPPQQQQQQQDILAAALQQQQQLLLQQQQLLLQQQQQQQQQLQQQMPLFQHPGAGGSGPARGAALQWDSGPYRSGAHDSHIFTHKGGVLDADHYHVRTHPHQAFGEDLQTAGAPGYGDASQAGTSYYAQGAPGGRPADEYGPARAPQRQYGAQYGAPPDYFYEDGGSESRLQLANLGRLGLQVPADDSSSRRLEADLTSVPYEKQLPQLPQSPQPGAGPAAAKQKPPPGPGAAQGADAPPPPRAEAANATAAPAAPDAAPTPRPRPQDKANSVKKQLEHATERSTAPPPATGRPPGDAALKNKTDAAHPKSAAGAKKAAAAAPGLSDGNLSLEQAALVDIQDGPTVSPKGAVISLVLGLVLTSFMVVVIICRIRTIKRRLLRRGGQSPYAHDADYLVNGMYL